MKKELLFSIIFFTMLSPTFSQMQDINTIRKVYHQAAVDAKVCNDFYKSLKNADHSNPLTLGYKGMAEFLKCYHSYNPYLKLKYFYDGKETLERAIQNGPDIPELRYLRFTIQSNAPSFLGYNENIEEDKKIVLDYIVSQMNGVKPSYVQKMIEVMSKSDNVSSQEKQMIESLK
jgi:hypothetical protein